MTQQIETLTVIGTITQSGNAKAIVTANEMTGSPRTVTFAVTASDTDSIVAGKMRAALALDSTVQAFFLVSGATTGVILTARASAGNDTTMSVTLDNDTCLGLTPATSANTQAGTGSITNGYCTLDDLKAQPVMNRDGSHGMNDDQFLCDIITAVSRRIDTETGRYFYKSTAHEVRYFTPSSWERCFIGDFVSVTALYTDTLTGDRTYPNTWTATDYDLWPYDAATSSEPAPYRYIDKAPRGLYQFTKGLPKGVKLDGVFGWPQVPSPIAKACLLLSYEVYKFYQTPLSEAAGLPTSTAQYVKMVPIDPRVMAMIANYARPAV